MNTTLLKVMQRAAVALLLSTLNFQPSTAAAQSTAFTYQGRLTENGAPAAGRYDLRGLLYSAPGGGTLLGATNLLLNVPVTNGLFTVQLDFGEAAFVGGGVRWLELAARTNGAPGVFTPLNARQPLTPTPMALWAGLAGTATAVAPGQVVKSLNGLTDAVTLVAGANVTLTPIGNSLQVAASGAAGVGGSGTANAVPRFTTSTSLGDSAIYQSSGRIGIGTATPDAALHVVPFLNDRALRVEGVGPNGSGGRILFGRPPSLTYVAEAEDDALYLVAPQGVGVGPGNLGIHVANLAEATHSLTVASANEQTLRLIGPSGIYQHGARLNFGDGNRVFLQEDQDDALLLYGLAGTRLTGGPVGIGTVTPQEKLDVDEGDILLQGPGSFDAPGETATLYLGDQNHFLRSQHGRGVTIGTYAAGDAIHVQQGTGNVGIGATTPAAKLEVAGTVRAQAMKVTDGTKSATLHPNCAFRLTVTTENSRSIGGGTSDDAVVVEIDHPLLNGDPDALAHLTPNGRREGAFVFFLKTTASLVWSPASQHWIIIQSNPDNAPLSAFIGHVFTILVIKS